MFAAAGGPTRADGLVFPADHSAVEATLRCRTSAADRAAAHPARTTTTTRPAAATITPATRSAVTAAFDGLFAPNPDPDAQLSHLEGGAALRDSFLARRAQVGDLANHTAVRIDSFDHATADTVDVTFSILVNGAVVLDALPGQAKLVDGTLARDHQDLLPGRDARRRHHPGGVPMTIHYRTCPLCEAMCGLELRVTDGSVDRIRGDRDDVWSKGYLCPKGTALGHLHEDPDRVRAPMIRTGDRWTEVDWDDGVRALRRAARRRDRDARQGVDLLLHRQPDRPQLLARPVRGPVHRPRRAAGRLLGGNGRPVAEEPHRRA